MNQTVVLSLLFGFHNKKQNLKTVTKETLNSENTFYIHKTHSKFRESLLSTNNTTPKNGVFKNGSQKTVFRTKTPPKTLTAKKEVKTSHFRASGLSQFPEFPLSLPRSLERRHKGDDQLRHSYDHLPSLMKFPSQKKYLQKKGTEKPFFHHG